MPLKLALLDDQQDTVQCAPTDAKGVAVPGAPSWSSDNTDVATVTPAADGLSCVIAAQKPGVAHVAITMTDPTGAQLSDSIEVTVSPSQASSLNPTMGVPTLETPAA